MHLPKIKFTTWIRWKDRKKLAGFQAPGVYILANFTEDIPQKTGNPLDKRVIYIGETTKNNLKNRCNQFHRSAFLLRAGHSGGITYRKVVDRDESSLYIAVFPLVDISEPISTMYIKFVERKLLLEYTKEWGNPPKCNRD